MERLEELRQLWQSQPQPPAAAADSRGMKAALRRFGRRQNLIYAVKAALMVALAWLSLSWLGHSVLTAMGAALFLSSALGLLFTDWRNQLGIARLDWSDAMLIILPQRRSAIAGAKSCVSRKGARR